MEDELHEMRERFYIGAFTACLDQGGRIHPRNDISEAEKKGLEGRCYLSSGKYSQLKDMRDSPEAAQRCCALFAMFLKASQPAHKQKAYDQLVELANTSKDQTAGYLAAAAQALSGDLIEAVATTQQSGQTAEMMALRAQLYTMLYRNDLATKQAKEVAAISDDHAISKVINAIVASATGNYQEAFLLYCDLEAQYGEDLNATASSTILNGKACANLQRGNFAEVPEDLSRMIEAMPNDQDTLVNLCSYSANTDNAEELEKYLGHLRKVAPDNAVCKKLTHLETSIANFVA